MTIWNCVEARRCFSGSVRGEISERKQQELNQHISDCDKCARELGLVRDLFSLRDTPPPDLVFQIKQAIRTNMLKTETSSWRKFLPVAALIAFIISASLIERVLFLPDISLLEQEFFVDVWPTEDDDLAGSLVLENFSDESLNLLFEEIR